MLHFVPPCDQEIGFDERSTMPPIEVSIPFWKCLRRAGSEFGVLGYHCISHGLAGERLKRESRSRWKGSFH